MSQFMQDVVQTVRRHFVSLSCVQTTPDGREHLLLFSGFVVEMRGAWCYVTAGHVLRGIDSACDAGSTFDIWRLGDQQGMRRFEDTGIPYGFEREDWLVLHDDEVGLDYAIVVLDYLSVRQLEAGNVVPLSVQYIAEHSESFEQWCLIGIPSESVAWDRVSVISARFILVGLVLTAPPPAGVQHAEAKFFAALHEESQRVVLDADGLSGGPVFALRREEQVWKYFLVGLQSAWYRESRTLAICKVSLFIGGIESMLQEALDERVALAVREAERTGAASPETS